MEITPALVSRLIAGQFPQWSGLAVEPVEFDGWDNRTFRLGEHMSVRLPSAKSYSAQVAKEQRWLPRLAPHLPLPIPVPLAMGTPCEHYPWHWSVYRWLEGQIALKSPIDDPVDLAVTTARFLAALQKIDPSDGPPPGPHNFFRGGPLTTYNRETREAIAALGDNIDSTAATEVWQTALGATWAGPPVWVHGDVGAGNLLVRDGRLSAVIDFGSSGVGDPACDLTIAWTFFSGESRAAFRANLPADDAAWKRGRGWALWKGLITLAGHIDINPLDEGISRGVIDDVLAEHAG